MSHTSVEFGEKVDIADLECVQLSAATDPGFIVLDKAGGNKWVASDADGSEVLAGKDGVGLLVNKVTKADGWGVMLRPKEGRIVKVLIDTLGVGAARSVFVLDGVTPGSAVVENVTSGDWKTSVGVGGTEGTTDTVDELYLKFHVSGQQEP